MSWFRKKNMGHRLFSLTQHSFSVIQGAGGGFFSDFQSFLENFKIFS